MISDLSIVIQGRFEEEQIKLWIENYSDWNVIISTWVDFNIDVTFPTNWIVIKSEYPSKRLYKHCQNIDYQLLSTLAGLNEVKTKYVVKVRGDEYWGDMQTLFNKMKEDESRILCGSIFFRKLDLYAFHISDHIMCSTTDNIKFLFETTYKYVVNDIWRYNVPESIMGFSYVAEREAFDLNDIGRYIDFPCGDYLKKYFQVIDVNKLKPFIITEQCQINKGLRLFHKDEFGNGNCIIEL
jgi:hypothetical protein